MHTAIFTPTFQTIILRAAVQAVVEVGSGIGSGVSAVGSQLDRMNENLSRSLHIGGGGARGPERSQPSLSDVFESARTGSLPMPAPEDDDDSAYSDVPARCIVPSAQLLDHLLTFQVHNIITTQSAQPNWLHCPPKVSCGPSHVARVTLSPRQACSR